MPQFVKTPVVITADKWFKNGDHPEDYAEHLHGVERGQLVSYSSQYQRRNDWDGQIVKRYRTPDLNGERNCAHCGNIMHSHGWIDTLEGGHIVCPGDWILTGVKGERYPCKPDIFAATYRSLERDLLQTLNKASMKDYFLNILIGFDQLLNTFLRGQPDETLSARAYRTEQLQRPAGIIFRPAIDAVFWLLTLGNNKYHCYDAFQREAAGGHKNANYR